MATKKISELEAITKAEDDDVLVIVDSSEGTTKKIKKDDFLSELQEENTELKEDLSDAEDNQLTAPASGESIDLNDSANAKIREPKLIGKSWQNSTTGKQLFNKNAQVTSTGNITSYTNNNGIYTIIPTGTGNPQIRIECIIPAGTYILNSEVYLSATQVLRSANETLKNFGSQYKNQNFTTTADSTEILFNWDNPGNTNPIILDLSSLMINTGSTVEPYEEYTGRNSKS